MPLPSLNLGRYAKTLDGRILDDIASSVGRGSGRVGRDVASLFVRKSGRIGPLPVLASRAAITGGAAVIGLGAAAVSTAMGLGYGAARLYQASLNAPTFHADSMFEAPFFQKGGSMLTWEKQGKIPFTQRHFFTPMASPRVAMMAGSAGIAAGAFGGWEDAIRSRRTNWTVTQALNTGAIEVERDNFMGATGSLTLAMYRQRYGRPAPQEIAQNPVLAMVHHVTPTEVAHGVHILHGMIHG